MEWVQYGCFGLVAGLLIWLMFYIPHILRAHKETVVGIATECKDSIKAIVAAFEKREDACREERLAMAELASADREKDRVSRHEANERYQIAVSELARLTQGKHPNGG